ncbi:MAG: hypothetical protein IJ009_04460 [Clostridia bacterium]|nr:hypothetical protein [Clostridia bacterium]
MRGRFSRLFWWQAAALLFCAALVILAVLATVYLSRGESFLTTAARTDILLSAISVALLLSICAFVLYAVLHRRHQN